MKLSYALEQRFAVTPDGEAWTRTGYQYSYWSRYMDVFDGVQILARAESVTRPPEGWCKVTGTDVTFSPIPLYIGPIEYIRSRSQIIASIIRGLPVDSAVILRGPGPISAIAARRLVSDGRPYGVEAVGDPYDLFAPGAMHHPLRPVFRWTYTRDFRKVCAGASAVCYVTQNALQVRYPTSGRMFGVSDVELPDAAFVAGGRSYADAMLRPLRLLCIGTLETPYKGVDVVLRAMSSSRRDCELTVIGEGRQRPALEALAARLDLRNRVRFLDEVAAGDAVRSHYDAADVFVLPSRTEGMPRVILEAMARGLPCIATPVGGIPELLDPEFLIPLDGANELSKLLDSLSGSPAALTAASRRNLAVADRFRNSVLQPIRQAFQRAVRQATANPTSEPDKNAQ